MSKVRPWTFVTDLLSIFQLNLQGRRARLMSSATSRQSQAANPAPPNPTPPNPARHSPDQVLIPIFQGSPPGCGLTEPGRSTSKVRPWTFVTDLFSYFPFSSWTYRRGGRDWCLAPRVDNHRRRTQRHRTQRHQTQRDIVQTRYWFQYSKASWVCSRVQDVDLPDLEGERQKSARGPL